MGTSSKNYFGVPVQAEGYFAGCAPQDVCYLFDDFIGGKISATDEYGVWFPTLTGAGTVAILNATDDTPAEFGGVAVLTPDATASDLVNLQVPGQAFQLKVGYPLYFETRISQVDVSDLKMFVGLAGADTALIPSLLASTYTEGCGFYINAGAICAVTTNASGVHGSATTLVTAADTTWYKLAFLWDGVDKVRFFIDDVEYTVKDSDTTANYVPLTLSVTPSIEVEDKVSATAAYVDYVLCVQKRYHA